jgi:quercetin dioxygenase-like cupin family protein
MRRKTAFVTMALGAAAVAGLLAQSGAPAGGFKRTLIQQADLSIKGYESVMAFGEFGVGAATGRHTHPGEEISFLLEGTLTLEVEGKPTRTLKAGDAFLIEAGRIHEGRNTGSTPARVLATYVVEKGKPLTTPAK